MSNKHRWGEGQGNCLCWGLQAAKHTCLWGTKKPLPRQSCPELGQEGGSAVSQHSFLPVPSVVGRPMETPWMTPGFLCQEHPCTKKRSWCKKIREEWLGGGTDEQRDTMAEEGHSPAPL